MPKKKITEPEDKELFEIYETAIKNCCDLAAEYEKGSRENRIFLNAAREIQENGNFDYYDAICELEYWPPTARELLESEDFLGGRDNIYPAIKQKFIECHPDVLAGEKPVYQIIDTGSLAAGKTFSMILSCVMTIIQMSCFKDPRKLFGLDKDTELIAILVGDGGFGTKMSLYEPARKMLLSMPFISKRRHILYDASNESVLRLSNGITLAPQLGGSEQWKKAIAIFFAGLDESNHQPVVLRSKKADNGEQIYDQARTNYDITASRVQSRFGKKSFSFYKIFVAGSAKRKTSMIENLIHDLEKSDQDDYRIYRNRQFDIRPRHLFSDKTFKFCLSSEKYRAHVLADNEEIKPDMEIMDDIPIDFLAKASINPDRFQRDDLGRPTDAIDSFIGDNQAIRDAFNNEIKSIVHKNNVVLGLDDNSQYYLSINEDNLPSREFRRKTPHWVHVDLSKNTCATGISMCYISHVEEIAGSLEANFRVPLCASIIPANNLEIRPDKIRAFIKLLRDTYGYNIVGISYDSFNSTESLQQLSDAGFNVAEISTVKTIKPYQDLKSGIVERRVKIVENEIAERELKELESEFIGEKEVVIKPVNGSKDICDTLAGAIQFALTSVYFATLRLDYQRTKKIPKLS